MFLICLGHLSWLQHMLYWHTLNLCSMLLSVLIHKCLSLVSTPFYSVRSVCHTPVVSLCPTISLWLFFSLYPTWLVSGLQQHSSLHQAPCTDEAQVTFPASSASSVLTDLLPFIWMVYANLGLIPRVRSSTLRDSSVITSQVISLIYLVSSVLSQTLWSPISGIRTSPLWWASLIQTK